MTYTVKDVANMTGLSIYTLHYYDKEGLLPFVWRNKSGIRTFTESDIRLIKTICCLKNTGMQIKDIKKYVDFVMEGPSTIDLRKKLLSEQRQKTINQIDALNENLKHIDSKLDIYTSPDAVQIINEQIKKASDDKRKNFLLSDYTQISKQQK